MIIVQGFMRVRAEDAMFFKKRLMLHCALIQGLDGCLQYSIGEDPGEPGLLWIGERWRDKAAQAAHLAGDHMGQFNQLMKHLHLHSAQIDSFECAGEGEWLMRVGV